MANQQQNTGSFVQTTQVWDIGQLYEVDVNSPEFKDLLVRLYQQINNISLVLNTKKSAYYLQEIFNNSSQWFNTSSTKPELLRPGFHKVVLFGAVNAGVNTQAHGINIPVGSTITFTAMYGAANNYAARRYFSLANNGITLEADNTNVIITNGSGVTFDNAYVTLEYLEY
jgi:hypothetical protein